MRARKALNDSGGNPTSHSHLRAVAITGTPRAGAIPMPCVRLARSSSGRTACSSTCCRTVRRTAGNSIIAKLAPIQRRVPPPNGINVYGAGRSRKRSGEKRIGSGYNSGDRCTPTIDAVTIVPAGSRYPPSSNGALSFREAASIGGRTRNVSLTTAVRYSSEPSSRQRVSTSGW